MHKSWPLGYGGITCFSCSGQARPPYLCRFQQLLAVVARHRAPHQPHQLKRCRQLDAVAPDRSTSARCYWHRHIRPPARQQHRPTCRRSRSRERCLPLMTCCVASPPRLPAHCLDDSFRRRSSPLLRWVINYNWLNDVAPPNKLSQSYGVSVAISP